MLGIMAKFEKLPIKKKNKTNKKHLTLFMFLLFKIAIQNINGSSISRRKDFNPIN